MGFNTVVLVLNDHAHEMEKAPHALTFAVTNPPSSDDPVTMSAWWRQVDSVARDHGENSSPLRSGLTVRPAFHADDKHVLVAGWNSLIRPKYEDYKYDSKNNKMTINMPEYWTRR